MSYRICSCGCGEPVQARRPEAIYATEACKTRAHRQRKYVAALAASVTPLSPLPNLKPSALRVLRALQASGDRGATTAELCQPTVGGVRFSARVMELRAEGFLITCQKVRNGSCVYRLVEHADAPRLDLRSAA